jgi:hypothetical protein
VHVNPLKTKLKKKKKMMKKRGVVRGTAFIAGVAV